MRIAMPAGQPRRARPSLRAERAMKPQSLRCHLYLEALGRGTFRLVVPRASDGLRLSTNYYHDTWHIVCGPGHAAILRKLFWAMAFDEHADTMLVLDGPNLELTPFDAAGS